MLMGGGKRGDPSELRRAADGEPFLARVVSIAGGLSPETVFECGRRCWCVSLWEPVSPSMVFIFICVEYIYNFPVSWRKERKWRTGDGLLLNSGVA